MSMQKKRALLECGCGCGVCQEHCCRDFNLEDTTLQNTGLGPGSLGCPDQPLCRTVECYNGWTLDVVDASDPEILEIMGVNVCAGFRTTGTFETNGLLGTFEWEVVVACVGNGQSFKAFIRYIQSPNPLLIPTGVWIETLAGWECPDCDAVGAGNAATAYLWFDVFVDCSVCNSADFVYGPPDGCSPDSMWSIRYYFSGQGVCEGVPSEITLTSSDDQSGNPANTDYTYIVPQSGYVTFNWNYVSTDIGPVYDPFGMLIDGVFFQLTNDAGSVAQSGSYTLYLNAGQIFGWRQRTVDNSGGSATTTITIVP
jgi:hypothetical protein